MAIPDLSTVPGPNLSAALTRAMEYVKALAGEIALRRGANGDRRKEIAMIGQAAKQAATTPAQRKKIARTAARARWAKVKAERKDTEK